MSVLQQPYLQLQPKVILRLLGINSHLDREIIRNDHFWKAKLEKDVLPPYHKRIVNYFRYYMLHNRKETGRLWKGKNQYTDLENVSRINRKNNMVINKGWLTKIDTNRMFSSIPAKELYDYHFVDLENNLRHFGDIIEYADIKERISTGIYLTTRGEVLIWDEINIFATGIVQAAILEKEIPDDRWGGELIEYLIMLNTDGQLLESELSYGRCGKIHKSWDKVDALISKGGEHLYLLTSNNEIVLQELVYTPGAGTGTYPDSYIIDFPIPIRRVIDDDIFVGYDGYSYVGDSDEPIKSDYWWLLDIVDDVAGDQIAIADAVLKNT